jgi:hypothetical protein
MKRYVKIIIFIFIVLALWISARLYYKNASSLTLSEVHNGVMNESGSIEQFQEFLGRVTFGNSTYSKGASGFLRERILRERETYQHRPGTIALKEDVQPTMIKWCFEMTCTERESWWFPHVIYTDIDLLLDSDLKIVGYRQNL